MTNDIENPVDYSDDDQISRSNDNDDDDDNNNNNNNNNTLSDLSSCQTPELNENDHYSPELHDQIDNVLHIDENEHDDDDDVTKFIKKARQQDINCLDLSKKNIEQFPQALLEFPSLQYLYLEGNQIKQLPDDLFVQLLNLKWIDLRNNKIKTIPTKGLAKHNELRYLLLGGNLIQTLPVELGKVKGLSALNLDGNPLEHPPLNVVKQGIKAIQNYLRDEHIRLSKCVQEKLDSEDETYDEERQIDIVADVWASDDEDNSPQRRITRSPNIHTVLSRPSLTYTRKSKSETDYYETATTKSLATHLQSCIRYNRVSYSEMRMHHPASTLQTLKSNIKLPRVKTKKNIQPIKTISNDPVGDAYAARAQEEQRIRRLKNRNIKIDQELQKVKTNELLQQWKDDYRENQQQFRRKRLIKGRDYPEAVGQAPFGIDPHYVRVMDKDQQEMVEKAIKYESRRNRSPESAMKEEEERRIRDKQLQDRIREITSKIVRRRGEPRGNAFEEKRQAELELRELRKLESEIKQRRIQVDTRFKAYTGDVKSRKKL